MKPANRISRNAEEMLNEEGKPKTSHTTNKVPFVMANAPKGWTLKKNHGDHEEGVLGDVAPTILESMGLSIPDAMDGTSLLQKS
jgi:2,3-bisphosphoglycerate-independent phosphoglycerate mutase